MMTLLYGPMTGDEAKDITAFRKYERMLKSRGIKVNSPIDVIKDRKSRMIDMAWDKKMAIDEYGWEWFLNMKIILESLIYFDAVLLMPNWDKNNNSVIVALAARSMGIALLRFRNGGLTMIDHNFGLELQEDTGKKSKLKQISEAEYREAVEEWNNEKDQEEGYEDNAEEEAKKDPAEEKRLKRIGIWIDRNIKDPPKQGGKQDA